MSDLGWNVWGAVTGVIGIIALIPLVFCWINSQLPKAQLDKLDRLLAATEVLFDTAVKDGLLHTGNGLHRFHVKLWAIQLRADDMRGDVYDMPTWKEQWDSWWRGTSDSIKLLRNELNVLRAALAKNSSRERRQLASAGYLNRLAFLPDGIRDSLLHPFLRSGSDEDARSACCIQRHLHLRTRGTLSGNNLTLSRSERDASDSTAHACQSTCRMLHTCDDFDNLALPVSESSTEPLAADTDQHLISTKDLHDLMSFVVSYPESHLDKAKQQRATRKELLARFGEKLFTPMPATSADLGAQCCSSDPQVQDEEVVTFGCLTWRSDGVGASTLVRTLDAPLLERPAMHGAAESSTYQLNADAGDSVHAGSG
ncbi:hypothetical protein GY45DRAFT_1329725 [Cubamyces sp. BRFM 1775]|nr:hypothetical protein GY45DRAFT_1329725 [Cubamyces sp. BRFM 1775]